MFDNPKNIKNQTDQEDFDDQGSAGGVAEESEMEDLTQEDRTINDRNQDES